MKPITLCAAIAVSVLASCATAPKFQKSNGAQGYAVRELDSRNHFMVELTLPSGETSRYYRNYGLRAIGEECKSRGFDFFNGATLSTGRYEGFCAPSMPKVLGIQFKESGLSQTPPAFEIESVASKPTHFAMANDKVLEMDGKKLVGRSDFLVASFLSNKAGKSSQHLKLERAGKIMTGEEPMITTDQAYLNSNDLEHLREAF